MKNTKTVDTAKKGQTTNKNTQPENVKNDLKKIQEHREAKKSKTPTGKVTLLKETEARKKARKEQYDNFRINALKRRCKRMNISEEDTKKYIEKLKEQLNSPNSYRVLVMFNKNDAAMIKQSLANESLEYKMMGNGYFYIDCDTEALGTLRGIMPDSAKIHPYVLKHKPILQKEDKPPVNGKKPHIKAERKAAAAKAKIARKEKNIRVHRNKKTGEIEHRKMSSRPDRHTNSTKKYTKNIRLKTLTSVKKRNSSVVVHMPNKNATESPKIAKKAA